MSVTAKIRMYNQQDLGDCFLLNFANSKGEEAYYLIDFGSYKNGNQVRENEIARHIAKTIGDKKLTIILTHQHKDHLSGFKSTGDVLKGDKKNNRSLWLSFLDDKDGEEGKVIRAVTEKYWKKNKKATELINQKFAHSAAIMGMLEEKKVYDLFAEEQSGGEAMTALLNICDNNVTFLKPGHNFLLPGLSEGVRVYVLGPPTKESQLRKLDPHKHEGVEGLTAMMELSNLDISNSLMLDALEGISADAQNAPYKEINFPFSLNFVDNTADNPITQAYHDSKEVNRQIEDEWLSEIGRMALHMDRLTNNTSLVLAFELVESKKVLLFVGDAQIGNWQSWFDVTFHDSPVTAKDLLSRTVLYKAGHHSSHNATLKDGLNLMNENELIIMVPVDAKSAKPFKMLKAEMLTGYNRKSKGKVLRSDTIVQDGKDLVTPYPFVTSTGLRNLKIIPDGTVNGHLALEIEIKG